MSSSILNTQTSLSKPPHRSVLRVKDGQSITRALSAPVLHDVPDIVVSDHEGAISDGLAGPSSEVKPFEEPSVSTDSFVVPSSMCDDSNWNKTPSPTPSRKSESARQTLNTIAAVSIATSAIDSRRFRYEHNKTKEQFRNKEKELKKTNSFLRNDRREDKRSRFERDKRLMYKHLGPINSSKYSAKKKR